MHRLLLVKTSSLGDVIHALPAVTEAAARRPDLVIDWVVEEAFADVPRLHPRVRGVIAVATRRWRHALWRPATWGEMGAFRRRLHAERYDLVLDAQGLVRSAVIARLARGAHAGPDRRSAREPLAACLYQRVFPVLPGGHAVARNRALVAQALGYAVGRDAPDYGIRAPREPLPDGLPEPFVVCLHGSSRAAKLWPQVGWEELARALAQAGVTPVLPWGNADERRRAEAIAVRAPGARVLPPLTLRRLAAVLARARAAIGVDTGPTHLAAALGVPTVAIYTDTAPEATGVYAPDPRRALNLGGAGRIPTIAELRDALSRLGIA